jgi:hypothetical protein
MVRRDRDNPVRNKTIGRTKRITYKGEKATIWIFKSACTDDAMQQTESMIEKMRASGSSPFSNYGEIEQDGVKIYSFDGLQLSLDLGISISYKGLHCECITY